jgi:hypothetical protein
MISRYYENLVRRLQREYDRVEIRSRMYGDGSYNQSRPHRGA